MAQVRARPIRCVHESVQVRSPARRFAANYQLTPRHGRRFSIRPHDRGPAAGEDSFARIGGDEFAVLLPYADSHQANIVADALRCAVSNP